MKRLRELSSVKKNQMYKLLFFLGFVVVSLFLDILTKNLVTSNISLGEVWGSFLFVDIRLVYNFGSAYGFLQGGTWLDVTSGILVAIALGIYLFNWWTHKTTYITSISFGLIIGGALGNLFDRIRQGFVPDFIDISFWPVFNIADTAISFGVVLLLLGLFLSSRKKSKEETKEQTGQEIEEAVEVQEVKEVEN